MDFDARPEGQGMIVLYPVDDAHLELSCVVSKELLSDQAARDRWLDDIRRSVSVFAKQTTH